MRNDGGDNHRPIAGMQLVAAAFDADKPCAGNCICESGAMLDRKDRICRAVNDEERNLQVVQATLPVLAAPIFADLEHEMIGRAQEAAGSVVILFDERPRPTLVEGV